MIGLSCLALYVSIHAPARGATCSGPCIFPFSSEVKKGEGRAGMEGEIADAPQGYPIFGSGTAA